MGTASTCRSWRKRGKGKESLIIDPARKGKNHSLVSCAQISLKDRGETLRETGEEEKKKRGRKALLLLIS